MRLGANGGTEMWFLGQKPEQQHLFVGLTADRELFDSWNVFAQTLTLFLVELIEQKGLKYRYTTETKCLVNLFAIKQIT